MAPHRRKAPSSSAPSPSLSPSEASSDSDLHLHGHSDPEEDGFFSARSGAADHQDSSAQDSSSNEEEETSDEEGDGGEMGDLEEEYRTLQTQSTVKKNILETLKQHRDDNASRSQAVKNQKAIWDKALEFRLLLQKAFSTSNKLPKEPFRSSICGHDHEVEKAYAHLLDSSKQALSCMLELQEALLERSQATTCVDELSSDSNGENDEWLEVQKLQTRITPFRNTEIDKWQRKTQVTTGAAALKGKLHAFNQNISDQVSGYMRDPRRMLNGMYLRRSAVGVFVEDVAEPGNIEEVSGMLYSFLEWFQAYLPLI